MDDDAHDLDAARNVWWCPDCCRRVYGLGVHWGGTGLCETSSPEEGGAHQRQETACTLATGGEPHASVVVDDACGSVPPRKDADE